MAISVPDKSRSSPRWAVVATGGCDPPQPASIAAGAQTLSG